MCSFDVVKGYAELIQGVLTSAAIVIGGLWTYNEFIRERPDKGRLIVSQSVSDHPISAEQSFIEVRLKLENVGSSRVLIHDGVTRIQQILPTSEKIGRAISGADADLTRRFNGRQTFPWPVICSGHLSSGPRSLEPDETLELAQDFLVPRGTELIRVYSYIVGDVQDADHSGRWADGIIYRLGGEQGGNRDETTTQVPGNRILCRNDEQRG